MGKTNNGWWIAPMFTSGFMAWGYVIHLLF